MNTFSRVYGKIIKYYLEESYKEKETEIQAGFRAGRSTIDCVFVINHSNGYFPILLVKYCRTMYNDISAWLVKQLIEKTNDNRQEAHFTFVDMEKAYDTVPLLKL